MPQMRPMPPSVKRVEVTVPTEETVEETIETTCEEKGRRQVDG